jgi:LytS/YehU family sensor histidine kinase
LKFFAVFLISATLLHLSKEWFELNEAKQKMIELEKEKVTAELKSLMNQVNPHFLFNSLNVLYSLAMKKSEETPEAILKLSDILRYVIYESNKDWVELSSEAELIHNYIALQKFRVDDKAEIIFSESIENENIKIAPMLFLPLVENAYKHGIKGDIERTFLKIELTATSDGVQFIIINNKGDQNQNGNKGVGLSNVKNRLDLIYPGKHDFIVEENDTTFRVSLKIKP